VLTTSTSGLVSLFFQLISLPHFQKQFVRPETKLMIRDVTTSQVVPDFVIVFVRLRNNCGRIRIQLERG
jgi:hypothetical protein